MAKAEKIPADFKIVLTLSRDEAETIQAILWWVGGDVLTTRRKHAEAIRVALNNQEITRGNENDTEWPGSIYFK